MILCHALLAAPLHLTRCRKTFFTADSLAFPDILPFPLLSRHRLSADLLALLYLHAVDEHAEVLADRDQRRMLVVKLHAQRSVHRLPDFGNRGGRLVADLVGVDDRQRRPPKVPESAARRPKRSPMWPITAPPTGRIR